MKKILFTGGGSAGHVTVNIALIPRFAREGWTIDYIGSTNGIEKQLISSMPHVNYHSISTGKLRRYFDLQNVKDPFRVVRGVLQAYRIIKEQKPNIVFSKGGFVSVPVVMGAWLNKVPVIIHESDLTPGLANQIASRFSTRICTTFPETVNAFNNRKSRYVGPVVREAIFHGDAARGLAFTGFSKSAKPTILVMGGSLGAQKINRMVREALPELTKHFRIIHLCGKGQLDPTSTHPDYRQYEYVNEELPDLLALCDFVLSRAGSNAIFEFLALKKPMLLIPLTKQQSRGDQLLNAASFERSGYCKVLQEEKLTPQTLVSQLREVSWDKDEYIQNMSRFQQNDALALLHQLITETAK
ncbi:undecaprenyldiphospho-muramoylpentapeptide beta-N-acetylglucosaminyltransferase [Paenibacillus soyae]|uniref:UDP-N-acetylglucosamine--N-acetylmuramyl-(pentapeptide) pyrophosphoryl-undecaprenol N-acetylglucosamine transferase n=1 Tax=Paenibacillus soyae TaxID=2969249 RepID=A0A9X2N0T7_9BACL|nr:undecaprenyldiphospho-muramoylpentapeptide beta-N-acetylglucosaminyltransferase [Paenibacillus soyae]MCR2806997.1 undecaprenyldiphospho-muramoylpentapeptide beta-N-acetylglucosaminyltransferase [Paenibacillus soyae]